MPLTHATLINDIALGTIVRSEDLGYRAKSHKYIWAACAKCGEPRWVMLVRGIPKSARCHPCSHERGEKNPNWKKGWFLDYRGYLILRLQPDHPYFKMTDGRGYVREHRLVMAQNVGRPLDRWEVVHHRNGLKDDNRIENLELLPNATSHVVETITKKRILDLEAKVEEQGKQLKLLKWQLRQFGLSRRRPHA